MPGKVPRLKVPRVELGELAYVKGDALPRLCPTNDFACCEGVFAGVLSYDVV